MLFNTRTVICGMNYWKEDYTSYQRRAIHVGLSGVGVSVGESAVVLWGF